VIELERKELQVPQQLESMHPSSVLVANWLVVRLAQLVLQPRPARLHQGWKYLAE
jgi:hypothetical protein